MDRVWEIAADPDRYLCVQQSDLRYFHDHFIGERMSADWAPPTYEVLNRSKKVADFTGWQIGSRALLVSEKARTALLPICDGGVEFLPFATIKGVNLFAMNVIRLVDIIDWNRSDITGDYLVNSVAFQRRETPPPAIFKDPRLTGWTFVTDDFGHAAVANGLTGLRLADPAKNRFRQIIDGTPINEFAGL